MKLGFFLLSSRFTHVVVREISLPLSCTITSIKTSKSAYIIFPCHLPRTKYIVSYIFFLYPVNHPSLGNILGFSLLTTYFPISKRSLNQVQTTSLLSILLTSPLLHLYCNQTCSNSHTEYSNSLLGQSCLLLPPGPKHRQSDF